MNLNYENKNLECGGIIINYDLSQLLIVYQRASQKWGLPKGHMNINEIKRGNIVGKLECSKREILEETGIDLNRVQHKIIGKENMNNKLFYIYKLENQIIDLEPEDNNEIEGIQWMDICEIENFINNYDCNRSLRELNKRKTRIKKKINKHINYYNPNQMIEIIGKV